MTKKVTISNDILTVSILTKGAELTSIIKDGKEKIWQPDPAYWTGQSPILFPICGGLKEDKYTYNGKEYSIPKHGFARNSEFEVESVTDTEAVLLFTSNEETLRSYPFEFEFRAIFSLDKSKLDVKYEVKNLTDGEMYFSVGAHEAYACQGGIENYSVIFDVPENLKRHTLDGNLLRTEGESMGNEIKELPLKYEYFATDALVFLDLKSRKVSLKNRETNEEIRLDFTGHNYFLLWTKPGAHYICLEPWCGTPDLCGSSYDITEKHGIIKLSSGESVTKRHIITF